RLCTYSLFFFNFICFKLHFYCFILKTIFVETTKFSSPSSNFLLALFFKFSRASFISSNCSEVNLPEESTSSAAEAEVLDPNNPITKTTDNKTPNKTFFIINPFLFVRNKFKNLLTSILLYLYTLSNFFAKYY